MLIVWNYLLYLFVIKLKTGTRCDNYTTKLITGQETNDSCHSYLTEAVSKAGLTEDDVHDVWNIFMCTGFTKVNQCISFKLLQFMSFLPITFEFGEWNYEQYSYILHKS